MKWKLRAAEKDKKIFKEEKEILEKVSENVFRLKTMLNKIIFGATRYAVVSRANMI